MTIEMNSSSLEARVIKLIREKYPITMKQMAKELHVSDMKVRRVIGRLALRGIVEKEVLPDATYVRLIRHDIKFVGRKADQIRPIKHTSTRRVVEEPEENQNIYQ